MTNQIIFENNLSRLTDLSWQLIGDSAAVRENEWTKESLRMALRKGINGGRTTINGECSCIQINCYQIYRRQGFNNYWGKRDSISFRKTEMEEIENCKYSRFCDVKNESWDI